MTTLMSDRSSPKRNADDALSWNWQRLEIGAIDLAETLDGGQAFRWHEVEPSTYEGVIGEDQVKLRSDDLDTSVAVRDSCGDEAARESALDYMATGRRPSAMFDVFANEPWATQSARERAPLRVLRQDPWECLAAFICSQNSNMVRIKQLVAKLAGYGETLDKDEEHFIFPKSEVVAGIGEHRLREMRFGYRAPHLTRVARIVSDRGDWLWSLRNATYDDAKSELMDLPGVGPKVADCVLAYSLDKGESFPIDVHVMRAMRRLYDLPEHAKVNDVAEWARDRFGDWSSLAQLYVFRDEVNRRT